MYLHKCSEHTGSKRRLVSHQLIHGLAETSGCVTDLVCSLLLPHGREILRRDEHAKEVVERLSVDEDLQAPRVEAEGTEDAWERGQNVASDRDVFVDDGVKHDPRKAVVL